MEIEIPQKPRIKQAEEAEDKRRFSVVPLKMLLDKRITPHAKIVMAVICSYANRAGITHVSQTRVASDIGIHQSRISRAMKVLVKCGYLEQIGRHSAGMRGKTMRVIYDPAVSTDDAVAVAQTQTEEDLRPYHQRVNEDAEVITKQKDDWTQEELEANKKRLASMLNDAFKTLSKPVPGKPYNATKQDSITVKKMRQAIREQKQREHAYEKETQSAYNEASEEYALSAYKHSKNRLYADDASQEHTSMRAEHICDPKRIESEKLGLDGVLRVFNENLFEQIKSDDMRFVEMLCQIGVTEPELIAAMDANRSATPRQIVDAVVNARV